LIIYVGIGLLSCHLHVMCRVSCWDVHWFYWDCRRHYAIL